MNWPLENFGDGVQHKRLWDFCFQVLVGVRLSLFFFLLYFLLFRHEVLFFVFRILVMGNFKGFSHWVKVLLSG